LTIFTITSIYVKDVIVNKLGSINMKNDISEKDLISCARRAAAEAIKRTKAAGGAITFQSGKKIIKEYADGRQEVLLVLDKAYVKPAQKVYNLG